MFKTTKNNSIFLTRGDAINISVTANVGDGEPYTFKSGDVVRLKVFQKNDCDDIKIQKDIVVESDTTNVFISLTKDETKIGDIINKPAIYWYEIELNPDTTSQTIIGYDENGPKIFKIFPEGGDLV